MNKELLLGILFASIVTGMAALQPHGLWPFAYFMISQVFVTLAKQKGRPEIARKIHWVSLAILIITWTVVYIVLDY